MPKFVFDRTVIAPLLALIVKTPCAFPAVIEKTRAAFASAVMVPTAAPLLALFTTVNDAGPVMSTFFLSTRVVAVPGRGPSRMVVTRSVEQSWDEVGMCCLSWFGYRSNWSRSYAHSYEHRRRVRWQAGVVHRMPSSANALGAGSTMDARTHKRRSVRRSRLTGRPSRLRFSLYALPAPHHQGRSSAHPGGPATVIGSVYFGSVAVFSGRRARRQSINPSFHFLAVRGLMVKGLRLV